MHGTEINNLSVNLIILRKIRVFQQNRGQIGGKLQLFGQKPPIRGQPPKIGGNVASMGVSEEAAGAAKERRVQALRTGAFVRMPKNA